MDDVKLMNRTDRKFWFNIAHLPSLLEDIKEHYYILEVASLRNMLYSTTYYDTTTNEMYNNHHRGKLNRFKIRRRIYHSSQSSFLEVKFKSNKGRTIKTRMSADYNSDGFTPQEAEFIKERTPYSCEQLQKVFENSFKRLMLVSKNMNERCTIDSSLHFASLSKEISLDEMVIVEVKTDGKSHSAIIDALNSRRLRPSGFSKYCIGRSLTDNELKINNFKVKHRRIEKNIINPVNNIAT